MAAVAAAAAPEEKKSSAVTALDVDESKLLGKGNSGCKIYGGTATVHILGVRHDVAIKVFNHEWFDRPQKQVDRIQRKIVKEFEIQRAAASVIDVEGGGICKVHGLFDHPTHKLCIVMQKYEQTLRDKLEELEDAVEQVELSKVLDWTLTLAEVIEHLHACDPPPRFISPSDGSNSAR